MSESLRSKADRSARDAQWCRRNHRPTRHKTRESTRLRGLEMLRSLQSAGFHYDLKTISALRGQMSKRVLVAA